MSDRKILEAGDILLGKGSHGTFEPVKVDRVTPTQAILSNSAKLKRDHVDGRAAVGTSGYGNVYYYLDTPDRRAERAHYYNCQYLKDNAVEVPKDNYGKVLLPMDVVANLVAIHKAAMLEISEIIKNEGLKNG